MYIFIRLTESKQYIESHKLLDKFANVDSNSQKTMNLDNTLVS